MTKRYGHCEECARDFPCASVGRIPKLCPNCRGGAETRGTQVVKAILATAKPVVVDTSDVAGNAPAVDERALDVIDTFGLDFNLGNAVRFILEADDGDRVTNLETAKSYLDRAIAKAQRAAAA